MTSPSDMAAKVDALIDERPAKELMTFVYDDDAVAVNEFIYRSSGSTSSYLLTTEDGRIIVNTGLGFESLHHRYLFDKVAPQPTRYIITTQGHTDHVGGVDTFRDPETIYLAHELNGFAQSQDARIRGRMRQWNPAWFDLNPTEAITRFTAERPDLPLGQASPRPDLTFHDRLALRLGGLDVELLHGTGETTDGAMVWLPQHGVAMISNLLGPMFCHFPNLNTVRGHEYRQVEPYLATIRRLRELKPETLITGRGDPIQGADLIDACLQRMHDAVTFVHQETLRGINEGATLPELVASIQLPEHLRVGQGYGRVAWGIRTIWETYLGWFNHERTAPLLSVSDDDLVAELAGLAGSEAVVAAARDRLNQGEASKAVALSEAALRHDQGDAPAREVLTEAIAAIADQADVEANFWLSGWLEHRLRQESERQSSVGR